MAPRPKSKEGARRTRLPEAMYHEHEADMVRRVAGHSISEFIRTAVLKAAAKLDQTPTRKK